MKGLGGGLQNIMRQANQMQMKMKKTQEEIATREFTGSSGGGAVKVTVMGSLKISAIDIQPDVMTAGDREMLQDLIMTATNEALQTAKSTSEAEMSKITGGASIPGMF
jgi:DNA-binding YbaB/EbfC family protein